MSSSTIQSVEGVTLVVLVVGFVLRYVIRVLARTRADFRIGKAMAVGFGIRMAAIIAISATGLDSTLRGGDETTFLQNAHALASQPLGRGDWPHGIYQLQTVVFGLQLKLGFLTVGALRITQVGIALLGVVLIAAAVHDLAGSRAARLAAWLLALEPSAIFFNSALHKEPLMELAVGLVVLGGTMIWRRLDIRGMVLCGLGGLIAVETRAYAGWFLVSAAVLVLLHAAIRNIDRPLRAMPVIYAVIAAAFVTTPTILAATSNKNLHRLQISQTANATGQGEATASGTNSSNLALEKVDFSTRGKILTNLPTRIRDVLLKPYPWQLGDTSQQVAVAGTLIAYAVLILLLRYAWLSRRKVFRRAGPFLWPLFFLLVAYSLAAGNAGTSFRYRSHLVTLGIGALVILRQWVLEERALQVAEPAVEVEAAAAHVAVPA